jgi:NAD(P)-dependent dehydrogenase (short-subunit alcohol dehydrogenase family)
MGVLDLFDLTGKVAVVTGGSGLYGRHFGRALGEAGATVVTTSRDHHSAERTAAGLRADGLVAHGHRLDLSDEESIAGFVDTVNGAYNRIDILVNNAVHRQGRGLTGTTADDWAATSAVNSRGLFLITQHVARVMAKGGGGSIINIGSIYGIVAPDFSVYEGTEMTMPAFYAYDKAGMIGFTRYLAAALGPQEIRVNCLCPGGMREEDSDTPTRFVRAYERRTPLGRMASGDDPAGALVFLASNAARYVTGIVLPVDGGWTAK